MKTKINTKIAALNEMLLAGASAAEILVAETELKTMISELNSEFRAEQFRALVASESPIMTALKTGNIAGYKLAKEKNPITKGFEYYLGDTLTRISLFDLEKACGKTKTLCNAQNLGNELALLTKKFLIYKGKKLGKSEAEISRILGTRKLLAAEVDAITTKNVGTELQHAVDLVTAKFDGEQFVRTAKVTMKHVEYVESLFNDLGRMASTVKFGNVKRMDAIIFDICRWVALDIEPEVL